MTNAFVSPKLCPMSIKHNSEQYLPFKPSVKKAAVSLMYSSDFSVL